MLTNSIIMSVFRYSAPILIDSTILQINRLQTLLIKNSRPILGHQSLKWSSNKILDKLNWVSIPHLIMSESLKFFHMINFEQEPKSMTKFFTFSLHRSELVRSIRKPMVLYKPKTQTISQSIFFKTVFLYNQLSDAIRVSNRKQFAKQINRELKILFPQFKIPKNE